MTTQHFSEFAGWGWLRVSALLVGLVCAPMALALDWEIDTVDRALLWVDDQVSIAVGPDGTPHIGSSLRIDGVVTYATKVDGVWIVEPADVFYSGTGVSVALDSQGTPCMTYRKGNPDEGERVVLIYAWRTITGWKHEIVDDIKQDSRSALRFAADGTAHIAYGGNVPYQVKHARHSSPGWIIEVVDSTAESYRGIDMALDKSGFPHICHAYGTFPTPGREEYAVWTGSAWDNQIVDHAVGFCNVLGDGIAVDAAGNTHMVWETHSCGPLGELRYGELIGGRWQVQTIDSDFSDDTAACSLTLDRLGRPHVVYGTFGMVSGGDSQLRYAHRDAAGNWVHEVIDADGDCGELNAVTIDPLGYLHVAYFAGDGYDQYGWVRYARSSTPVAFNPGDLNCDGAINTFDIDPFVLAVTDASAYAEAFPACDYTLADINGDGAVNVFDVDPFVALLAGK